MFIVHAYLFSFNYFKYLFHLGSFYLKNFPRIILIFWNFETKRKFNINCLWYLFCSRSRRPLNIDRIKKKILFTIVNRTKTITMYEIAKWILHGNYTKKFRIINNVVNQTMIIEHVITVRSSDNTIFVNT